MAKEKKEKPVKENRPGKRSPARKRNRKKKNPGLQTGLRKRTPKRKGST